MMVAGSVNRRVNYSGDTLNKTCSKMQNEFLNYI